MVSSSRPSCPLPLPSAPPSLLVPLPPRPLFLLVSPLVPRALPPSLAYLAHLASLVPSPPSMLSQCHSPPQEAVHSALQVFTHQWGYVLSPAK